MPLTADFNPSVPVTFQRMRQLPEDSGGLQAGVVGANDFKVSQRAAGANMSVDVAAGQAWVEVTTGTRNGLAHVVNDATANVTVTAAHATLPRVDQVVLRYNDTNIPTGAGNAPTLEVLAGTATSGATLDNRTGAPALGADRLRLADILVPAASTSVVTANIRDRRPWARGAFKTIVRTAGDITGITGTGQLIDAVNMVPRIECSGVPVRVTLHAIGETGAVLAASIGTTLQVDGAYTAIGAQDQLGVVRTPAAAVMRGQVGWTYTFTALAAGSHTFGPFAYAGTANGTLLSHAGQPIVFTVEEIVRPDASNT